MDHQAMKHENEGQRNVVANQERGKTRKRSKESLSVYYREEK